MATTVKIGIKSSVSRRQHYDLATVVAGTAIFYGLSIALELSERMVALTQPWERYQLDEVPGVLLFLALALSWFSWRRVCEARVEIARREVLEQQLADTLAENRRLSLSHVHVQEDERKQLARELHDELGQHLNAIKIDAVAIRGWSHDNGVGQLADMHAASLAIIDSANHVQVAIRDMLRRLRPAGLDELGLAAALENLVQQWQARNPPTRVALEVDDTLEGQDAGIDQGRGENVNMTCYRLVQEALTNVTRHAAARNVRIHIARGSGELAIRIGDDGVGAPATENRAPGLGLVGMRERVEALGGTIRITSAVQQGFRIEAVIPVAAPAAAQVAA